MSFWAIVYFLIGTTNSQFNQLQIKLLQNNTKQYSLYVIPFARVPNLSLKPHSVYILDFLVSLDPFSDTEGLFL